MKRFFKRANLLGHLEGNCLRLGKFAGIEVYIHASWFIIFFIVTWSLADSYYPEFIANKSVMFYWAIGAISATSLFSCVLLHEYGHSLVSVREGIPVPRITLFIFGGVAQISREPRHPWSEIKITIAGPLVSILLAIFFALLYYIGSHFEWQSFCIFVLTLVYINIVLVLFNMIPGFPLDGGRLLRALIWLKTGNLLKATFWSTLVGRLFAFTLIFGGIFFILDSHRYISGVYWIFMGILLRHMAILSYQHVAIKTILDGVLVKEIMEKDCPVIADESSLYDLKLRRDIFTRQSILPVVTAQNELLGFLTNQDLYKASAMEPSPVQVKEIVSKLRTGAALHPDYNCITALNIMNVYQINCLPVLDDTGFVGILTQERIFQVLQK